MIYDAKDTKFIFEIAFTYTLFSLGNQKEYNLIIKNIIIITLSKFKPITIKLIALITIL